MQNRRFLRVLIAGSLFTAFAMGFDRLFAQEKIEQTARWATPTYSECRQWMMAWRDTRQLDEAQAGEFALLWPEGDRELSELGMLELAADTFAKLVPDAKAIVDFCRQASAPKKVPAFALLQGGDTLETKTPEIGAGEPGEAKEATPGGSRHIDRILEHTMRLYLGRWLVQHSFYDEAIARFGELGPGDVVAPATLLFHQSVAHHRLLQKEACLPKIALLLENEDAIPRRYREVSRLMAADIKPLKVDSLDEVSRLMDDVRRRLDLGRAGKRVRDEEDDVVAKLDKMIEELEKQQQQQQQQAGGAGGGAPNQPLPDSMPAGGRGPGNVTQRDIGSGSGWGNLPPREREEALQAITKNLPSHYREVIEEYFRKLARTSD